MKLGQSCWWSRSWLWQTRLTWSVLRIGCSLLIWSILLLVCVSVGYFFALGRHRVLSCMVRISVLGRTVGHWILQWLSRMCQTRCCSVCILVGRFLVLYLIFVGFGIVLGAILLSFLLLQTLCTSGGNLTILGMTRYLLYCTWHSLWNLLHRIS